MIRTYIELKKEELANILPALFDKEVQDAKYDMDSEDYDKMYMLIEQACSYLEDIKEILD